MQTYGGVDVYIRAFFTSALVYPWAKSPRYPSDRRLGGSQGRFVRCGVENNFFILPGIEPLTVQPVDNCNAD
jgi:hypothetical protein